MFSLNDIDDMYPTEQYGSLFSKLYFEHHGHLPHDPVWATPEDFLEEFDRALDGEFEDSENDQDAEDPDKWEGAESMDDLLEELDFIGHGRDSVRYDEVEDEWN